MRISRNKILSLALIVSLAVNLVIGGFIITQWVGHGGDRRHGDRMHFDRRAAITVLSDPEKELLDEFWKERRQNLRPYFREFRENRQKLAELFTAETLDIPAINKVYADMIAKQMQIETFLQTSMLEMAKTLPENKRAAFFKEGFTAERKKSKPPRESSND